MIKDKEVSAEKIIVKYEDGTEKEINKGVVICDSVNEDLDHTMTMEFVNISGQEFSNLIFAILNMAGEMGLFKDINEAGDEDI